MIKKKIVTSIIMAAISCIATGITLLLINKIDANICGFIESIATLCVSCIPLILMPIIPKKLWIVKMVAFVQMVGFFLFGIIFLIAAITGKVVVDGNSLTIIW